MSARTVVLSCALAVAATPACADLPGPVRAMIEAAMQTDDAKSVDAVVKAAKATQPQDGSEIDAMKQKYDETHTLVVAEKAQNERERVLAARPLQLWKGEGEIGAFNTTGNTNSSGVSVGLKLERDGVYWQHKLQFTADYQKTGGVVSREQYLASYNPRYTLSDRFYAYGLGQFESDEFQGYDSRYSLSPGFGYRVYNTKNLKLSIEGGPALRFTDYIDEPKATTVSALGSLDFSWKATRAVSLKQQASAYVESDNSTFTSTTSLEAGMLKGLKARLSYRYEHDTDPPDGSRRTDTLSRFTLVYGF
jgi:putative salt-induced outer membrane protein